MENRLTLGLRWRLGSGGIFAAGRARARAVARLTPVPAVPVRDATVIVLAAALPIGTRGASGLAAGPAVRGHVLEKRPAIGGVGTGHDVRARQLAVGGFGRTHFVACMERKRPGLTGAVVDESRCPDFTSTAADLRRRPCYESRHSLNQTRELL